jgi:MFS family permease
MISVGTASRFLVGVVLFGQPAFVPPFIQGAMGVLPTLAGFILSSTSVGWTIASHVSGRAILRWGYRMTGVTGAAVLALGCLLLRLLDASDVGGQGGSAALGQGIFAALGLGGTGGERLVVVALVQFVIGLGFGAVTPVTLLSMQNAVDWGQRGVTTSTGHLALTVGGTLGVSLAGALFGLTLASATGLDPTDLLSPGRRAGLAPAQLEATRALLVAALAPVYTFFLAASAAGVAIMALLPRAERKAAE